MRGGVISQLHREFYQTFFGIYFLSWSRCDIAASQRGFSRKSRMKTSEKRWTMTSCCDTRLSTPLHGCGLTSLFHYRVLNARRYHGQFLCQANCVIGQYHGLYQDSFILERYHRQFLCQQRPGLRFKYHGPVIHADVRSPNPLDGLSFPLHYIGLSSHTEGDECQTFSVMLNLRTKYCNTRGDRCCY